MKPLLFICALVAWSADAAAPFKPAFACKEDDLEWAGMTCSEQEPCPIYLEAATVQPVGTKLLLSGNIHSAQSTFYSILLQSDDGGTTWREPVERVRGSELDAIQFVDSQNGWISGQRVFPIAGDPFFLITTDGGTNWHKSEVLSEGADGAIQSFRFETARSGTLTLDRGASTDEQMRYARYETMTGGTSWSVRETSEKPFPPSVKGALAEAPLWRVRGDAAHKLLLIEKNTDGTWKQVASLALELAQCTGLPTAEP